MSWSRRLVAISLVAAATGGLGGCGDDRPQPDERIALTGPAHIGATDNRGAFLSIPPTGELELEPGAQGGFHVPIQVRISAAARDELGEFAFLERTARRLSDDTLTSRSRFDVRWVEDEAGWSILDFPAFVFLCPTQVGIGVADEPMRLEARIGDPDEFIPLVATATVTPRCPTGDQQRFCDQICRG